MPIARKAAALLMLTAVTGCTGRPDILDPPPSMAASGSYGTSPVARCTDAVNRVTEPGDGYRVVAGVVAVPGSDRMLEPAEQNSGDGPTRLFAKWGLLVHTGTTVDVSLLPGWDGRARINWGDATSEPATSVRIVSCGEEPGEGRWAVFTGGTWVIEPDCVPIRITTATGEVTVELSIGTPCSRPGG
ncbi:hypothetical protein Ait01nite_076460 [Actinoplanes italicus]|uniref:Uncharacterized protein n=1 Tax=Actinoplanes italicus TaxID=113567 RepID=A0A2T0JYW8_9ACTN|nr:hypothetical protein [Actinoplanes italicus]PRX14735.1 hypothetical protein CLV67_123121 [Actinoplanes italicus]GIE34601.1 hypothetical protein Ait01nite_076460 [Actinoplanes italicus]